MDIHDLAEITSLVLTTPTIFLSVAVVWLWAPSAVRAVRAGLASGDDWFILGVTLGFVGSSVDNLYWSLPWTASFLSHPWADPLFESGVYINVPFRQGFGICAAYCHLRAAEVSLKGPARILNKLLVASYVLSFALLAALLSAKFM